MNSVILKSPCRVSSANNNVKRPRGRAGRASAHSVTAGDVRAGSRRSPPARGEGVKCFCVKGHQPLERGAGARLSRTGVIQL